MNKLILVLLASIATPLSLGHTEDSALKVLLPNMIKSAEVKYDLPESLLAALIQVESGGKISVINKDDGNSLARANGVKIKSHGLVQIQLGTARLIQQERAKANGLIINKKDIITSRELLNADTNIEYGAMYLKWLLVKHDNDISWALTCYNGGHNSRMCLNKVYYGKYVGKILNAWISIKASKK